MANASSSASPPRADLALLVLRVIVGLVFAAHGFQKLFLFGFGGVIGAFGHMGIPVATITGPFITLLEFLGGLALIAGIFTRAAGLLFAVEMLVAILLVHAKGGFFNPNGIEFPLTLLAGSAALAMGGPGAFALRGRRRGS